MNLGNIFHLKGSYDDSLASLMNTMELLGEEGDHTLKARILHNMGITYKAKQDDEKALECFNQSIEVSVSEQDYYLKSLSYLEKSELLSI